MARYTTDSTVTIPQNATNITVTVAGARGGSGGSDGAAGGSGGSGRVGVFYFPSFTPRTLTLRIGSSGGNGVGCVSNGGAGSGGSSNVASGGSGGRTGPQGCSGGGAGGGGASGVFDSIKNGWVIIAAGGGGGGGGSYPDSFLVGGNGGFALGFETGNVNNPGNGGTGASQGFDGGGGGGGGGGCPGGGGGREGADDRAGRYASGGGSGGASGYDSNYVSFTANSGYNNQSNGYIDVDYTLIFPTIDSFTSNPSAIILGQSSTLTWTTSNATNVTLTPPGGSVAADGNTTVSPLQTTTYTLRASAYGETVSLSRTIIVYIPPEVILSLSQNAIILGECATLSWVTTGDADTISIGPGISNSNLTSSTTVCPTQTTTYSATVSGNGGTDSDSITLIVYYPPTVSIDAPLSIDYGQQGVISYTTQYSNISVVLYTTYFYRDGTIVSADPIQLNKPNSAEPNVGTTEITETVATNIAYTEFGPRQVTYSIQVTGSGGQATATHDVTINIDATPDNMILTETGGKFKSQDPVYTPDIVPQEVIESQLYLVDGVDVAVELQANQPIQVDLNKEGIWRNVREI